MELDTHETGTYGGLEVRLVSSLKPSGTLKRHYLSPEIPPPDYHLPAFVCTIFAVVFGRVARRIRGLMDPLRRDDIAGYPKPRRHSDWYWHQACMSSAYCLSPAWVRWIVRSASCTEIFLSINNKTQRPAPNFQRIGVVCDHVRRGSGTRSR